MNPKYKKILEICFLYIPAGLLVLMILANLYLGINKAITRNPVPKLMGFSPLVVLSGSMEPAIYPGDVVVIRQQAAAAYKVGDIATYLIGQTAYTHRIVRIEDGLLVMKGDNNNTEDDIIAADKLEGKTIFIIPKVGLAIVFFKKPAGMAVLALLLLLCAYSGSLIRKLRKTKKIK